MTKNQQILFDLLVAKNYNVKRVKYYSTFGCLPGGWFAIILENDEDGDEIESSYFLGLDFIEAKGQIENNEIKREQS